MKTIGLIGGMSWESTAAYYRLINEMTAEALGGLHSAKIVVVSIDYHDLERLQATSDWITAGEILARTGEQAQAAGAEMMLICSNTMHKVAHAVVDRISVPLVHIGEATAHCLIANGVTTIGLLGTRYTMCQDFYTGLLEEMGLEVILPESSSINMVNSVIFNELRHGVINDESRENYRKVIESMKQRGAQAVVLGCTEVGLLVNEATSPLPVYNTTRIHAHAAVHRSLADEKNCRLPRL